MDLLVNSGFKPFNVEERTDEGYTALHPATLTRKREVMLKLIYTYHASTTANDNQGQTVLFRLVYGGHRPVVERLLGDFRAEVVCEDELGNIVLHEAMEHKRWSLMQMLVEADISPDISNRRGSTPLHSATLVWI